MQWMKKGLQSKLRHSKKKRMRLSPKCLNYRNRWAGSEMWDYICKLHLTQVFVCVNLFLFFFKTEQLKENQKQSKEKVGCTVKKIQDLEVRNYGFFLSLLFSNFYFKRFWLEIGKCTYSFFFFFVIWTSSKKASHFVKKVSEVSFVTSL